MAVTVGYCLSSAIAIGILFIGTRFPVVPHAAAAGFGVAVNPDAWLIGLRKIMGRERLLLGNGE